MSELLTAAEVAKRLKVTTRQVYKLVAAGKLKGTRLGGKTVRVFADSVEHMIEEGKTSAATG